jgi:hypothetical protein
MTTNSHPIRNSVIATLIATSIIWVVSTVIPIGPILGAWVVEPISVAARVAWQGLIYRVPTPAWVLGLLLLISVFACSRFLMGLRGNQQPQWMTYLSDHFYGTRWRWQFTESGNSIVRLTPYCPVDDTQLVGVTGYLSVHLKCETCSQEWGPFSGSGVNLEDAVKRQIDRKLRTGEWTKVGQRPA